MVEELEIDAESATRTIGKVVMRNRKWFRRGPSRKFQFFEAR
jgi:hypothetical protein